jgi:hypothetical protein
MATRQKQRVGAAHEDVGTQATEEAPLTIMKAAGEESVPSVQESTTTLSKDVVSAASLKGGKIRLSSGDVYEIRRARLLSLALTGQIPDPLIPIAVRAANKGLELTDDEKADKTPEEIRVAEDENALNTEKVLNAVVCAVSVNPKIVMTPEEETDDTIWVGRLDALDKWELYGWAMAGHARWAEFRIE